MKMRVLMSAVLYTALAFAANTLAAQTPDIAALRTGDMLKLAVSDPVVVPETVLLDEAEGARSLQEYHGKYVLLNLWATWCAPCREEMPTLDRLQAELGGDRFAVVTVATGRNAVSAIQRFFADQGVTHLPIWRDPKQDLAHAMGVLGLPATILIDPEGREVARITGPAAWDGPDAKALLTALIIAP
jgi:thiol-disulfide isomerase/thioredoxin